MLAALTLLLPCQLPADPLAVAKAHASAENQRLLVIVAATPAAPKDEIALALRERSLSRELLYEYQQLRTTPEAHPQLMEALGPSADLPQVLILDADGKALAHRAWASMVAEDGFDHAAMLAFLKEHEATPRDAVAWLEQARLKAKAEGKRLFVHLGAPW